MYGYEVPEEGDPVLPVLELVNQQFSRGATPGAFLVDLIPVLRYVPSWVPGAGFKKIALEIKKTVHEARDLPFDIMKEQMV